MFVSQQPREPLALPKQSVFGVGEKRLQCRVRGLNRIVPVLTGTTRRLPRNPFTFGFDIVPRLVRQWHVTIGIEFEIAKFFFD